MVCVVIVAITALMTCTVTANAQTAIQKSKLTDNIYIGLVAGASTPLDFNSTFPLNSAAGLKVGKYLTPVFGIEAEGIAIFNDNHFGDFHTGVKATNVSVTNTINLSNAFAGYNGKPRTVEFKTNVGLGWLHTYGDVNNALTAKTALDVFINIGQSRTTSLVVSPGVYWNLSGFDQAINNIQFNKNKAQFAVMASFLYNFKNSNGKHYFKTYDVGAMTIEMKRLNEHINECHAKIAALESRPENVVEKTLTVPVDRKTVIFFAQNSSTLDDNAKDDLDSVNINATYVIDGYASIEGPENYNQRLSEHRAANVADYLAKRGATIKAATGHGIAYGDATGRVVTITVVE